MENSLFERTVDQITEITGYSRKEAEWLLIQLEKRKIENGGTLEDSEFVDFIQQLIRRNLKA